MPVVENPILLDIPSEFETPRLRLRVPRAGDGQEIYHAVQASRETLDLWLSWPERISTPELAETEMRRAVANFILRSHMLYLMVAKENAALVGVGMIHHLDWEIPSCELGYWLHTGETGKGYMVEAVTALTQFCFNHLLMERIEIRCDPRNIASAKVAQKAGYTRMGILRNAYRDNQGELTDSEWYFIVPPPS